MNSVRIKICGITSAGDADLCREAGAGYLGFVFHPESPRYISPAEAGRIIRHLHGHVTPVGVFVNPTIEMVEQVASISGIRMVQLSGDESPEICVRMPLPVIKVLRPGAPGADTPSPGDYPVFATMVDGAAPGKYGGTGLRADPRFAAACVAVSRCFLAGGLNGENVIGMLTAISPFAVDVSSGIESRPGVKDREKVRRFCNQVFQHNQRVTTC